jgi:hypothetical protein
VSEESALLRLLQEINSRLDRIETRLSAPTPPKSWYTIEKAAQEVSRAPFTVREWCRLGQCAAEKSRLQRGGKRSWLLSAEEVARLKKTGPDPMGTHRQFLPVCRRERLDSNET